MAKRKSKSKQSNLIKYAVFGVIVLIVVVIALQASGMTAQFSRAFQGGLQNQQMTIQQVPQTSYQSTSTPTQTQQVTYEGILNMLARCKITAVAMIETDVVNSYNINKDDYLTGDEICVGLARYTPEKTRSHCVFAQDISLLTESEWGMENIVDCSTLNQIAGSKQVLAMCCSAA